jgi:hypothetical protein
MVHKKIEITASVDGGREISAMHGGPSALSVVEESNAD